MEIKNIYDDIVELLERKGYKVKQFDGKRKIVAYSNEKHRIILSFYPESLNEKTFVTKSGNKLLW